MYIGGINESRIHKGMYIVCYSENEAKSLLIELDRLGYVWNGSGDPLTKHTFWENNREGRLAYFLRDVEGRKVQNRNFDLDQDYIDGYEVLNYEDVMFVHYDKPKPKSEPTVKNSANKNDSIKSKKENRSMNMFGINMECGASNDPNISSTFLGIAVKNGESWRIYDKEKKTLTDIGNMSIGNLPLFIMPSTDLQEGDLIKNNGHYFYVVEMGKTSVKTLSASTGEIKEVVPVNNILGINFYSKVIALADDLFDIGDTTEGDSTDKLMMAMALSSMGAGGDDGGQNMSQMLLPLMLLKDKGGEDGEGKDKKTDKLLRMMLISQIGNSGGDQSGLLPLLFLKKDIF